MDVRQLRHVIAIHTAGSFARAADDLGLAQSTLSKSIARLEDQLGLRLFDRSGAGAVATPMGLVVAARAERIIADAERLQRDVELAASGGAGEIRIGLGPALRPSFLPRFAEALMRRWPRLKVVIDVERRERLIADFRAGRYDIIVAARVEELETPDHAVTEILREPVVPVAAPGHPLAALRHVRADDFLAYPHAAASAVSMLTGPGAVLDDPPSLPTEPQIQCSDDETVIALARAGLATAFLSRHIAQAEIDEGRLVALALKWRLTIMMVAITTRAASASPLISDVVRLTRELAGDLGRSRP